MRPMAEVFIAVLLVRWLVAIVAVAGEREWTMDPCEGSYINRRLTSEELATVLHNHQEWLKGYTGTLEESLLNDTRRANLCRTDLRKAELAMANLYGANLQGAHLGRANLQGAHLAWANLQGAQLTEANLQGADLSWANLQGAQLFATNLQGAILGWANLQGAVLAGTNLQEADLSWANLQGAVYEPNPGKLPLLWTLTAADSQLETLRFDFSPAALIELREAFKKGGMRTQERQLTYAIEHLKQLQAWHPGWRWGSNPKYKDPRPWREQLAGKSESLFSYVFFELPSHYGMAPRRALGSLLSFIPGFALLYWIALQYVKSHSGLWMVVPKDRIAPGRGKEKIVRISRHPTKTWRKFLRGESRLICTSLYFSVLSAFHLGWRELNVGTWITRMQPREYTLRATGWVRTVSGIQSLVSVYLLALWVLTYFGRPFE